MSKKPRSSKSSSSKPRSSARQSLLFAALGDETRLALVRKLSGGEPSSITQLTTGSRITRQAITKHLRVLEHAGIARAVRHGRESLYQLNPKPIDDLRRYLDLVSSEWDKSLARLKAFVESD
jgi:DNA-binding transcriptional ArsR family regulator